MRRSLLPSQRGGVGVGIGVGNARRPPPFLLAASGGRRRLALHVVALGPKSAKPARAPRGAPADPKQLTTLPDHDWPAAPVPGASRAAKARQEEEGGSATTAAATAPPPSKRADWSERLLQLTGGGAGAGAKPRRRRRSGDNPTASAAATAAAAASAPATNDDDDDDDVIFGGRAAAPPSVLESDEDYDAQAAAEDAAIVAAAMEQYGGFGEQRGRRARAAARDEDDDEDAFDDSRSRSRSRSRGGSGKKRLPAAVRCFDTARISVKAGDGGAGCVAFRREPYVERGGPNGGNGGRGGNVWAVADEQLNSLVPFRHRVHWRALNGAPGKGSQCDGADGADAEIPVPLGTIVRARDARPGDPPLAELVSPGQRALLCVGGRGGRGNASFKTARDTAPALAERGEPGEELWLDLELKVVADVGLVGVPNAGKSTLLSRLTAAKPKIAAYPFTTLVPNLGVCEHDYRTTVFADIPGLLEGAHDGRGLGHEFLRHVSRCRAIVHVVDGSSPDPVGDLRATNAELALFSPLLSAKPQVVAYNKVDLPDSGDYWELVRDCLTDELGVPAERVFPVSAATGRGVAELVRGVRALLDEMDAAEEAEMAAGREGRQEEVEVGEDLPVDAAGPARLAADEAARRAKAGPQLTTDALNRTAVPRRFDSASRIDDFTVELLGDDYGDDYDDDEDDDEDEEGSGKGRRSRRRQEQEGARRSAGRPLFGDDDEDEDDDYNDAPLDGFGARAQDEAAAAFADAQNGSASLPFSRRELRRRTKHLAGGAGRGGAALPPAPRPPGGPARTYLVRGSALERFTRMTNWDYYEAVRRFQKVLDVSGVNGALQAAGVREGDTVVIGDDGACEFEWRDAKGDSETYAAWAEDMRSRGKARAGSSAWPTGN
jgi:GTP-binding protein